MLNNGVPVHIVANRLGHTDAATTLSIYIHVMPSDDRVAADAMARVFFAPGGTSDGPDEGPDPTPSDQVPSLPGHRRAIATAQDDTEDTEEEDGVTTFPQVTAPMTPGGRGGT